MTEKTMTLSEALELKKSLKRKIDKRLQVIRLSAVLAPNDDAMSDESHFKSHENEVLQCYQSLSVLSANYDILCAAITTANAKAKTDMTGIDGKPMTVAQLLAINGNDSIAQETAKAMQDSYLRVRKELSKYKPGEVTLIDPLSEKRKCFLENHDNYIEDVKAAIHKANAKAKVKVIFID